ncbi:SPOR domain-containing protein [Brevundimonas sp. NPDC092305]|uniref:SPOR domain-containing protein n=1 Tax=Brevundimonas sp. NPDC092305 TaxID=3363957 RepID=UPI0038267698
MTPRLLLRPVLASLAAASLSACNFVQDDPHKFESMAESIAAIPVDGARASREAGLRPAVEVEVMTPHALWDARDGDLAGSVRAAAPRLVEAAAPAVAEAVIQRAKAEMSTEPVLRPAIHEPSLPLRQDVGLVQLGAYASEGSARAAWNRLKSGPAAWALEGLSPVYEPAEVNGRRLVRLKTRAPGAGAAALCAAAGIDDPWCHQAR